MHAPPSVSVVPHDIDAPSLSTSQHPCATRPHGAER